MTHDAISTDLKQTLKRLKLGPLLDILPERLALARQQKMPHQDFLLLLLADEVTRRDSPRLGNPTEANVLHTRRNYEPGVKFRKRDTLSPLVRQCAGIRRVHVAVRRTAVPLATGRVTVKTYPPNPTQSVFSQRSGRTRRAVDRRRVGIGEFWPAPEVNVILAARGRIGGNATLTVGAILRERITGQHAKTGNTRAIDVDAVPAVDRA